MADEQIPYLCGGTFLAQILRTNTPTTTAADRIKGKKESRPEREVFRRLISVYQLKDFYEDTSLKTYTTYFKTCAKSLESYTQFSDYDLRRNFDEDIRSPESIALAMMSGFVHDCVDSEKYVQLVRCLLDMIRSDAENLDEALFFVQGSPEPVKGKELCEMDTFTIESFLLGVWHFIIMHRSGSNEKGAATYCQWYPDSGIYRGEIGNGITREIHVVSVPMEYMECSEGNASDDIPTEKTSSFDENASVEDVADIPKADDENTRTVNQTIGHATIVNQYGGKNIHIDHVDTLNL